MSLRRLRRWFFGSDLLFWRKLRSLRALNRALRRNNQELLADRQAWIAEREAAGRDLYWYQRWRELHERPTYLAQGAELERARTELNRLRSEVATLRLNLARLTETPPEEGVSRGPESRRDWEFFRRS
jgi:hypothetical protein